jgi:hypothetical protein
VHNKIVVSTAAANEQGKVEEAAGNGHYFRSKAVCLGPPFYSSTKKNLSVHGKFVVLPKMERKIPVAEHFRKQG